tara:strand:- start:55 stop:489 length:435 start_codon:yes stop_codon:yes gene_type:complete
MALDGGGGGGGLLGAGNAFTGIAASLEIVGDFGYALSGLQQINTSEVPHIDFTSGNYTFEGSLQCQGATKADDPATGKSSIFTVSFNGIAVAGIKVDSAVEGMPSVIAIDMIIPPYTQVVITCRSPATTAGLETAVIVAGKIHR